MVNQRLDGKALVVRPTYVVGPYDYTHRFTYWVERIAAGGEVLAPRLDGYGIQVIDARDQAEWTIDMIERRAAGTYHTVSPAPPFTFEQMLQAIVDAVAPPGTAITYVDSAFLAENGVTGEHLPLWYDNEPGDLGLNCNPRRAYEAGLRPRPLEQTIRETLEHERRTPTPGDPVGLPPGREAELLRAWAARKS